MTDIDALLARLDGYNPPDRTKPLQRKISEDIHDAAAAIRELQKQIVDMGITQDAHMAVMQLRAERAEAERDDLMRERDSAKADLESACDERDALVKWNRALCEEMVLAGMQGGDRTTTLGNVRRLIAQRDQWHQLAEDRVQMLMRAEADIERAYQMLEANGIPRGRAKSVSNGIDVLATRMNKAIQNAEAERDALRKDAERYRWLRANNLDGRLYIKAQLQRTEYLDAAIDAALRGEGK